MANMGHIGNSDVSVSIVILVPISVTCRRNSETTICFKDYHMSPPRLFAVKKIFYCFIKFLSPNIIVFGV